MNNIQIKEYVKIGAKANVFTVVRLKPIKSVYALIPRKLKAREERKRNEQILHKVPKYRYNTWFLNDIESQCVRMLYPNTNIIIRVYSRRKDVIDISALLLDENKKIKTIIVSESAWILQNRDTTGDLYVKTVLLE